MEKVDRVHRDWQVLREARWVHTVLGFRSGQQYAICPLNGASNLHWFGYIHGLNRKIAILLYVKRDCLNFTLVTFPGSLLSILVLGWEGSSCDEMVCSMWLYNVSYSYQISCFYSNLESTNISEPWCNASGLIHLQARTDWMMMVQWCASNHFRSSNHGNTSCFQGMLGETGIPGNQGEKVTNVSFCHAKYLNIVLKLLILIFEEFAKYLPEFVLQKNTTVYLNCTKLLFNLLCCYVINKVVRFHLSICASVLIPWLVLQFYNNILIKGSTGNGWTSWRARSKRKTGIQIYFFHTAMSSLHLRRIFMFPKISFAVACFVCSREKLDQ